MLHPSYTDLMEKVNSDVEPGEAKVVNSRYSIVMATSRRARQLIDGYLIDGEDAGTVADKKPLSIAVEELYNGDIQILNEKDEEE
ncbi:MAG: DNA-directed RNA polymerase subunit omega [Lachnospiraceae bacterium]|nr:DNA-directed RNA polymerase subunit omega [Lachnospiraceae bacterium]